MAPRRYPRSGRDLIDAASRVFGYKGGSKKVTRKDSKTLKHHKKVKSVKTHKKNKLSSNKK